MTQAVNREDQSRSLVSKYLSEDNPQRVYMCTITVVLMNLGDTETSKIQPIAP